MISDEQIAADEELCAGPPKAPWRVYEYIAELKRLRAETAHHAQMDEVRAAELHRAVAELTTQIETLAAVRAHK